MSDQNPDHSPAVRTGPPPSGPDVELVNPPNKLDAGRGTAWLGEGWRLFKKEPWLWIGMVAVYFAIMFAIGMIPVFSIIGSLLGPVFVAGFMLACKTLDRGEPMQFAQMFAGFSQRTGPLIGVGALAILGTIAAFLVAGLIVLGANADIIMNMLAGTKPEPERIGELGLSVVLAILVAVALALPIYMALWFAPVLVILHGKGAVDAMKLSFAGCLGNILPMLFYGVVVIALAILASIPLMLGWLVLLPALVTSTYAAYKEIFLAAR